MIIVRLYGGLGNQLFQYAVGRHLAYKHNTLLKLNVNTFKKYKLRSYSLGAFNICENYLSFCDKITLLSMRARHKLNKYIENDAYNKVMVERSFRFDKNILLAPDNVYLIGWFQSEKYFKDIEYIIKKEISVKYAQEGRNQELAELIKEQESVSIHIRRGDYVTNPSTYRIHGLCGLDYYLKCISYLEERLRSPYFYIFSDDIQWAKKNLKISSPMVFVDNNDASKNYEDLRLMSQCHHNIIANSSFSWWSAWLNNNPKKIVMAPKRWFATRQKDTRDLIPEGWICI
jgi:hypothetical protein